MIFMFKYFYYLDSAASEANDTAYYNTFVEIAASVE